MTITQPTPSLKPLDVLTGARKKIEARPPTLTWLTLGLALEHFYASPSPSPSTPNPVYRAAELTGYGVQQLRAIERMLSFLRAAHVKYPEAVPAIEAYSHAPISHIHAIARIFSISEEKGLTLLRQLATDEKPTYRDLVTKIRETTAESKHMTVGAGRRAEAHFAERCFAVIFNERSEQHEAVVGPLLPEHTHLDIDRINKRLKFAAPDIVIVKRVKHQRQHDLDQVDGMICRAYSSVAQQRFFSELVEKIAFASTFFSRFWLFLPSEENARAFAEILKAAGGFANVGVAVIASAPDESGSAIMVITEPLGEPTPDRRAVMKAQIDAR